MDPQLVQINQKFLSDGSTVYDVVVVDPENYNDFVTFPCFDEMAARALRAAIRENATGMEIAC